MALNRRERRVLRTARITVREHRIKQAPQGRPVQRRASASAGRFFAAPYPADSESPCDAASAATVRSMFVRSKR
jgi:hypothetical protein